MINPHMWSRVPLNRERPSLRGVTVVVTALWWTATCACAIAADTDRWFTIEIDGVHSGWMHETQSENSEDGSFSSETNMQVTLSRGNERVEMRLGGRVIENADGEPMSVWTLEHFGDEPKETTFTFTEDAVHAEYGDQRNANDSWRRARLAKPSGEYFTPREAQEFIASRLRAGADEIQVRFLDPLSGVTPVEMQYKILERDLEHRVLGKTIHVTKWSVRQIGHEGSTSVELVDEQGRLIQGTTTFGSLELTFRLSDEPTATRRLGRLPDLMTRTFIKPDRTIRRPRNAKRMVVDLSLTSGSFPEIAESGAQTVERRSHDENGNDDDEQPEQIRVIVDVSRQEQAPEEERSDRRYLASSSYINSDSAQVRELTRQALRSHRRDSAREQAEALRTFVYRYVKHKDLGVAFAGAEEVARNRSGDCTEHAVLLAAMLRAQGIPSRVVSGLIYADRFAGERRIFGYHMWTQALIDGAWVDLDSTLARRFDATHIALQTSPLDSSSVANELSTVTSLVGRLRIRVVDVDY